MSNIIIPKSITIEDKINRMHEDARFEVASDEEAESAAIISAANIKGRPALTKIPKVFLSNECIFNCAYCGCRCGREDRRVYANQPRELAEISIKAATENGRGVFVTSAIYKNADYTQELIAETVKIMRIDLGYKGFIHAKVMPGVAPMLITKTGLYANRLSVNIEVAHSSGYQRIAKQKNKKNILRPMREICNQIEGARYDHKEFAISQTTQLMAGSINEDDRRIIKLSRALYQTYNLKRVYYTPFQYIHEAKGYENEDLIMTKTPKWRMTRLYQADRLLKLYNFTPDEITPETTPFLEKDIDPKAAWALRHLEMFPVEVNTADYDTLIRVPGIGVTYAKKIIAARLHCTITHERLKRMRIALKRSIYFITCNGTYKGGKVLDSTSIRDYLMS